ncbi:hypothetical protein [Streptomyces sp. NPDC058694]|uniref:hypothetical protein n=1 Tax=Streptomyces sp. NPDC058694 TaxID=3346603 RepID=UPI00366052A3
MRITHTPMSRDDAVAMLGPHWPPRPGTTVAYVGLSVAIYHGAVAVHTAEGQPGTTWWAVDGLLVTQDAGPPPSLYDCLVQTVPDPVEPSPPLAP